MTSAPPIVKLRNNRMLVLLSVLAALVLGGGAFIYHYFFNTYHFLTVTPNVLYRDGYRGTHQMGIALANSQAKSVISLVDANESATPLFQEELEFLSRTRVRFYSIPVPLGGYPTTEQVREFLDRCTTTRKDRLPVLVHCAQGIRRTGMMVAAYQMSVLGWTKDQAKANIKAFGHSDRTINDIKRFIDVYDPIKREVTQTLPRGKESSTAGPSTAEKED